MYFFFATTYNLAYNCAVLPFREAVPKREKFELNVFVPWQSEYLQLSAYTRQFVAYGLIISF